MTAILVVNGEPVNHCKGDRAVLFEYLYGVYSPLFAEPYPDVREDVVDVDDLRSWCDTHAGIEAPVCDIYDDEGYLDFYVLTDPFYLFEIDNEDEKEAIRAYCADYSISIED